MEIVVHWTLLDTALSTKGVDSISLFYLKDGKHVFLKTNQDKVKEKHDQNIACNNG